MKDYSELLRDPRWQRKRLEIMSRDNFCCVSCGRDDETLNVHHCLYQRGRMPWEYPNSSLITVCESCHKEEHKAKDKEGDRLLFELRNRGATWIEIGTLANVIATEIGPTRDDLIEFISTISHVALFYGRLDGFSSEVQKLIDSGWDRILQKDEE